MAWFNVTNQLINVANPDEINVITGPTTTSTTTETMNNVNSGWKIERRLKGKTFLNQLPTGRASHAAKMIGKIEYVYEGI